MNPEIFGWEHLTYLAIFIVITIASLILIKLYAKSEKAKFITVKVVAGILLASILWNRICICISNQQWKYILPNTFCGMNSLVLALTCLIGKKDNAVMHYVNHVALVGDILTLIYPDFIVQNPSIFYPNTISGLLRHSVALYLCILLLMLKWFVPNYKKWPNLVIGFLAYITVGAFQISVLGYSDAFYIYHPILPNTPLTVWPLAVIFAVGYVICFASAELVKRTLAKRKGNLTPITQDVEKPSDSVLKITKKGTEISLFKDKKYKLSNKKPFSKKYKHANKR